MHMSIVYLHKPADISVDFNLLTQVEKAHPLDNTIACHPNQSSLTLKQ